MRVGTWTMYQNYSLDQQSTFSRINTTYNQISSGQNIQYGYQDINIQTNALRLNNQLSSLELNKNASYAGKEFGLNSDTAMNDMVTALTTVKSDLLKASNNTNSQSSLEAIAQELEGLKKTLMTLANSSLNGQYLFSGTATTTKAIASDGTYQGNAGQIKATISSGTSLAYNIDGKSLFLGQDSDYSRNVTTNVQHYNKTLLYATPSTKEFITSSSTIKDLTGNAGDGSQTYFYVSGTNSSGASFKQAFGMSASSTVGDLLTKIKGMYSNDVDVTINGSGEIEVKDLLTGSSKLDFKMVASNNSTSITKATAGIAAGSTSMTVSSARGIQAGDVLDIENVGQVTVSSVNLATNTVNFVGTPLAKGLPSDTTTVNVTKSTMPTSNTTSTSTIAASSASPQTISVASTSGAVVGGTLALVDAAGNSISGTISAISGTNVTFTYTGASPAAAIATPTVKFTTPGSLNQSTTLSAAAAAGANSITVASSQGISVGGSITLAGSNGSQTLKVTGIDSATGTLTLQDPPGLLYGFNASDSVTVNASTPASYPSTSSTALATTASPSTNITVGSLEGLSVGGKVSISGVGVFNISALDSSTNTVTIDTFGQAGISIPSGSSITNASNNTSITEFTKSGSGERVLGDVSSTNNYMNHSLFDFNTEFYRIDNGQVASENDRLIDVLGNLPTGIKLNNTNYSFTLSSASTITDYVNSIQSALNTQFGSNKFIADYVDGRIQIQDTTIADAQIGTASSSLISATLTAPSNTFSSLNGVLTDNTNFAKSGNTLLANVSQITKDGNEYVTPATKLVEAGGVPNPGASNTIHPAGMEGHILEMPLTTTSGIEKVATLNFQYDPTASVAEGKYRTIYSISENTTAAAAAAAAATTITVPSGLSIYPGSSLEITLNSGQKQTVSVSAVSGTTVTLASGLSGAVNSGNAITVTNSYDVPNAGYPGLATTSTQPNNFTYDQMLDVISMSVSSQQPALGLTAGAVTASAGTGSVALTAGSNALSSATVGADIMLYDNNNVPYYATVSSISGTTVNFTYNQNSWSSVGFASGNKIQVGYANAADSAQVLTPTTLDANGKIKIQDTLTSPTRANFALYDQSINSGYGTSEAFYTSALTVNSNNAITIDDPYVDFFSQLDEAIAAVRSGNLRADSSATDPRNAGIQNAIAQIDHILDHTERKHTEIGAAVDTFQQSYDRIEILSVNIEQVRSNFTDTDYALASVELNQKTLSYQALMSLATKINSLSLVQYIS